MRYTNHGVIKPVLCSFFARSAFTMKLKNAYFFFTIVFAAAAGGQLVAAAYDQEDLEAQQDATRRVHSDAGVIPSSDVELEETSDEFDEQPQTAEDNEEQITAFDPVAMLNRANKVHDLDLEQKKKPLLI